MAKKASAKKSKSLTWPNGKKVAVSITVMFETWPDDSAPNYSIQTTHLKKGTVDHAAKAWSTYGGRVGVWRLMRTFERLGIPGDVLRQRALHRGSSRRGQADRQVRLRHRRAFVHAG